MRLAVSLLPIVIALAVGCTTTSSGGPAPSADQLAPTASDTITVLLRLPESGHFEAIDGEVALPDGETVATFRFAPDVAFVDDEPDDPARPATSVLVADQTVVVELPGPGAYVVTVGRSFFWGGCGTCGSGYDETTSTIEVTNGAVVVLDLGEITIES